MPNEHSPDRPEQPNDPMANQDRTINSAGNSAGISASGEFAPGDVVGGAYEVLSFIGAGGMGNVYRVRHTILQTDYALKTLSSDKVTEVAWRRFQVEAQAIARMSHPNIVGIYNLGLHNGQLPYYVMDILSGRTLLELLQEKQFLPIDEALKIFLEVCAGIGYAHKKGIVHRDIKPGNIVILDQPDGSGARVKIVDFGIAKLSHTSDQANQQLTSMGEVCGSPFYMSPEQCQAGKIDARSDSYSLGCTLFEALTGSPPFKGRNAMETMFLHSTNQPPTLAAASGGKSFPSELETVLARAMAKAPMDRYQTTEAMAQDLEAVLRIKESGPTSAAVDKTSAKNSFLVLSLAVAIFLAIGIAAVKGYAIWHKSHPPVHSTDGRIEEETTLTYTNKPQVTQAGSSTTSVTSTSSLATASGAPVVVDKTPWATYDLPAVPGKSYIHFKFPRDISLGQMKSVGTKFDLACRGQLPPLIFGNCVFEPDPLVIVEHPEYLDRFSPTDLRAINIDAASGASTSDNFDRNTFQHIMHLKGLVSLGFVDCSKINDSVMDDVEQFPLLKQFTCTESNISITRLTRSPILKQLDQLTISARGDLHPLLLALKDSKNMAVLDLSGYKLSREDLQIVATMPNLWWLRSKSCAPTDADLQVLSKLTKLQRFDCSTTNVTRRTDARMRRIVNGGETKESAESRARRETDTQDLKDILVGDSPK